MKRAARVGASVAARARRLRRRARRGRWRVEDVTSAALLDRLPLDDLASDDAVLVSIYRSRNAGTIAALAADAGDAGWRVLLWALDETVPEVAHWTVGEGPGERTTLLNRLVELADAGPAEHVVIVDDDVEVVRSGLSELLQTVVRAGFGLAQPAHHPRSHYSHRTTVRAPWSRARQAAFVEIGPVVVVSPAWRSRVFPIPDGYGMGWGLELLWSSLADEGCRLGIVDAVPVRHLDPPATTYDPTPERARVERLAGSHGGAELFARPPGQPWRPWRRRPPWDGQR